MLDLVVLVGSLQKNSINRKLAFAMQPLCSQIMTFNYLDISGFPLYNQDIEEDMPQTVALAKIAVSKADGVLFVTPEYNRSIPGVLKNAIDWISRPWGKNTWDKKPVGIAGISQSPVGTAAAQAHMRDILSMLGMRLYCRPEVYLQLTPDFFAPDGSIANQSTSEFLKGYLENLARWIEKAKD